MNNIKTMREKRHLTQSQVAIELGLNRSSVAKWETGGSKPRVNKLLELSQLYNCTIDELLKGNEGIGLHQANKGGECHDTRA